MPTNVILERWRGGWTETTSASSIATYGRKEALLDLGAAPSKEEATRVAGEQIDANADPRLAITAEIRPVDETDTPYLAWGVGDLVTVPALGGGTVLERCIAMAVEVDDNNTIRYVPELKDPILEARERTQQAEKKMIAGAMRGQTAVAQPVAVISTKPAAAPGILRYEATFGFGGILAAPATSPTFTTPVACRPKELVLSCRVADPIHNVDLYVLRNGINILGGGSFSIPATYTFRRFSTAALTFPDGYDSTPNSTTWAFQLVNVGGAVMQDLSLSLRFE